MLSGLVSNGTITQSQADAIIKAAEGMRAASKSIKDARARRECLLCYLD